MKLTAGVRGLITLYTSTMLAGMWAMVVPTISVLAQSFNITPGTAAQLITALAVGRFAGMPISGWLLDHFGSRTALIVGRRAVFSLRAFADHRGNFAGGGGPRNTEALRAKR